MMALIRFGLAGALFVLAAVSHGPAEALAQTVRREAARPISSVAGADIYKAYCAACHGPDGKGNGPAAAALKTRPADLTQIAKRNGGRFSQNDVERFILGKDDMPPSHGSREMPIWGPVFRELASDTSEMTLRVNNLVSYLKSIQAQ
jgi:mono/diheme cytochrome c family protein